MFAFLIKIIKKILFTLAFAPALVIAVPIALLVIVLFVYVAMVDFAINTANSFQS